MFHSDASTDSILRSVGQNDNEIKQHIFNQHLSFKCEPQVNLGQHQRGLQHLYCHMVEVYHPSQDMFIA